MHWGTCRYCCIRPRCLAVIIWNFLDISSFDRWLTARPTNQPTSQPTGLHATRSVLLVPRFCRRLIFSLLSRGHVCQKMFRFIFRHTGTSTFAIIAIYHGSRSFFWPVSTESQKATACVRSVRTCCRCRRLMMLPTIGEVLLQQIAGVDEAATTAHGSWPQRMLLPTNKHFN